MTLSPLRQQISTYWQFYDDNIVATDVIAFLRSLHRQQGRKLIIVLDRFNVHRKAIRLLQESGAGWLSVEWLPGYAPDLNPVEAMWSCTKYGDLANFTPDDVFERAARLAIPSFANTATPPSNAPTFKPLNSEL